ncbi:MAG: HDOD domain-containing protein [Planctomycetes bacterium]|nr:HDOD domain-containing protein [Planctomycetota bacterium]
MAITTTQLQEQIKLVLEKLKDIPTLPQVYTQVQGFLENPKSSAKNIAETIQSDPAIASKVLKIANSPFYGFPQRITTITHAIVVLGFSSIKNIVLSCSVVELFKSVGETEMFDYKGFWKHCVATGAFSKIIGKNAGIANLEEVFLAGLLHDLGKIVIFKYFPDEAKKINKIIAGGKKTIGQAEKEALGFSHTEISTWLYEKWNLSRLFIEVAMCHHNPAIATHSRVTSDVVHIADILARAMGIGWAGDHSLPNLQESSLNRLRIKGSDFSRLIQQGMAELGRSKIFIDALGSE